MTTPNSPNNPQGAPSIAPSMCDDTRSPGDRLSLLRDFPVAAANVSSIIASPKNYKRRMVLVCAFGAAVVQVCVTQVAGGSGVGWYTLPAAGVWEWYLQPDEGMSVRSTLAITLPVAVGPA